MAYYNQGYGYPMYSPPMPDQLSQLRYGQGQFTVPQMGQAQTQMPQVQEAPPIIWVQGEAGAKAHMVAPGNSAVLWDSENPYIYIKTADASGMPSMRIIEWKDKGATSPMPPPMPQNQAQYVTLEEYNKLAGVVNDLVNKLNNICVKENGDVE